MNARLDFTARRLSQPPNRGWREAADPATTDVAVLANRRVLLLADAQNLSFSLRKRQTDCDYAALLGAIRKVAHQVTAHAFAWVEAGEEERYAQKYFEKAGWVPHIWQNQHVLAHDGTRHRMNCDSSMLLWGGSLISRTRADAVVLATGDGDLAGDMLHFMRELRTPRTPVVMGVAGCISSRLQPAHTPEIAAVIALGRDVMVRF